MSSLPIMTFTSWSTFIPEWWPATAVEGVGGLAAAAGGGDGVVGLLVEATVGGAVLLVVELVVVVVCCCVAVRRWCEWCGWVNARATASSSFPSMWASPLTSQH